MTSAVRIQSVWKLVQNVLSTTCGLFVHRSYLLSYLQHVSFASKASVESLSENREKSRKNIRLSLRFFSIVSRNMCLFRACFCRNSPPTAFCTSSLGNLGRVIWYREQCKTPSNLRWCKISMSCNYFQQEKTPYPSQCWQNRIISKEKNPFFQFNVDIFDWF